MENGAGSVNGGGLHFSNDYGFSGRRRRGRLLAST